MDIKNFEEKTVASKLIFDGAVVHLYRDDIELPNGKPAFREYVKHVGAVCVVPVTDEGEVICVRQYRYPFGKVLTEIPAGKLDSPDEDPTEAVLRELREETGATPRELTFIGDVYPSVAILNEVIHMYMATGLSFGETDPDEDEFLDIVKIPIEKMVEMIMNGEICDSKTQTAVLKAYMILNKKG